MNVCVMLHMIAVEHGEHEYPLCSNLIRNAFRTANFVKCFNVISMNST